MTRRGFSLIELLMAIFILGIGLISIAALFPAGILLQQRGEDELNGPIVAAHAIELIRNRLSPDDFGSWWDLHDAQVEYLEWYHGVGGGSEQDDMVIGKLGIDSCCQPAAWMDHESWPWLRPAMVTKSVGVSGPYKPGTLDVFNSLGFEDRPDTPMIGEGNGSHPYQKFLSFRIGDYSWDRERLGIPFHPRHIVTEDNYGIRIDPPVLSVPRVLITPEERSWPQPDAVGIQPKYYWDCAFRRTGSEVQVAIFVYRAERESLSQIPWTPGPINREGVPGYFMPVPWPVDLGGCSNVDNGHGFDRWAVGAKEGPDDFFGTSVTNFLTGTDNPDFGWMLPGQWLVDQRGDVHRVASGRNSSQESNPGGNPSNETPFSLTTPVGTTVAAFRLDRVDVDGDDVFNDPQLFTSNMMLPPETMCEILQDSDFSGGLMQEGVLIVDRLWYVPPTVTNDSGTYRLLPIYVTVASL